MKLAEALLLRADANKRIHELQARLQRSARIQEGDTAPENAVELMDELARTVAEVTRLVKQINRTNAQTAFDESRTLTDALADRDALTTEYGVLIGTITHATGGGQPQYGYNPSPIKHFRAINVADVQKRADDLARRRRELDTQIQQLNWSVDLIE
jgi:hypothetical protein